MPGKPLIFKAFRASLTLVPARYIAPADPKLFRDLALCARNAAAETVAQRDDLHFPLCQAFLYQPADEGAVVFILQVGIHRVVHADNIHQIERVAVLVRVDRFVERHLALQLLPRAKMHQDLIFHTSCSVGGKSCSLFRAVAGDALDQADCSDGNQIVLFVGLCVVLLE